jgi:ERCC4-related helicase
MSVPEYSIQKMAEPHGSKAVKRSLANAFDQVLEKNQETSGTILSNRIINEPDVTEKALEEEAKKLYRKEVQAKLASLRVKPGPETANQEKLLKKIGTAGVVQFFNAVYKVQQAKDANTEKQKLLNSENKRNKDAKRKNKSQKEPSKPEGSENRVQINFLDLIKR